MAIPYQLQTTSHSVSSRTSSQYIFPYIDTKQNNDKMNLESEISFSASRSSGPGGQNVNKVNTRIVARFDVMESNILNEHQKHIISHKLQNRINKEGQLIVACEETRSQRRNKEMAINLLHQLIAQALKPVTKRKPTKPTRSSKLKRLQSKKIRSQRKENRRRPDVQ